MKVVAFNGSPRVDGNTNDMLRLVLEPLEAAGHETELVPLAGKKIQGCIACFRCAATKNGRCAVDDDANECIQKMIEADAILLGSPTYFADVTASMKALIDRGGFVAMQSGGLLKRKVGAAVVAMRRAGGVHVFDTINHFFLIHEMIVPGSSYWNLSVALNKGEAMQDAEGAATMRTLGENIAWLLDRIDAGR